MITRDISFRQKFVNFGRRIRLNFAKNGQSRKKVLCTSEVFNICLRNCQASKNCHKSHKFWFFLEISNLFRNLSLGDFSLRSVRCLLSRHSLSLRIQYDGWIHFSHKNTSQCMHHRPKNDHRYAWSKSAFSAELIDVLNDNQIFQHWIHSGQRSSQNRGRSGHQSTKPWTSG